MAADKELHERVLGLLAPLGGVSSKSMFGGFGIFHEGDMFALISGHALFFKVDDSNRARYEAAGSKQYKPMPYFQVPESILRDSEGFLDWARESVSVAHASAGKKKR